MFKNEKQDIFTKIASIKVNSSTLLGSSNNVNSFASISNKGSIVDFLLDLMKTLEDVNQMKGIIIDAVYRNTEDFETKIKSTLIKEINKILLCHADPTVPSKYLYSSSFSGIEFPIKDIDFFNLLKTNPTSDIGKLLYFDNASGFQSKDMNTFLFQVVSTQNTFYSWRNIIYVKHINNKLVIKINNIYNGKKLSKFVYDLVNSIDLIDTNSLFNNLIDSYSSTLTKKIKKSREQIESEVILDTIIDRIINEDENEETKGYFTFSNNDNINIEEIVSSKLQGTFKVDVAYDSLDEFLSFDSIEQVNNDLNSTTNPFDIEKKIRDALNSLGSIDLIDVLPQDIPIVNLNFIETLIKNFGRVFVNVFLSPKVLIIFSIANAMANNPSSKNSKEFVKDNLNIMKEVISIIKSLIIGIILDRILKLLKELIYRKVQAILKEKINNRKKQIKSLRP